MTTELYAQVKELVTERRHEWVQANFKIIDKGSRLIPLQFNPVQSLYWERRTLRDRILKPRQAGMSTIALADILSECMLRPGLNCLYQMQKPEDETLRNHRERARLFYNSTQEGWRPKLLTDNDHQMTFGFPDGMTSTLYFSGSGGRGAGRGETLHRVVRDEIRDWEDLEVSQSNDSLLGMPADSRIIDISTPSHWDSPWHKLCQSARDGLSPFTFHIYRWFEVPEYTVPDMEIELTADELVLKETYDLNDDQLAWRRQKVFAAGSQNDFWREYLEDDFHCWTLGGEPVMPADMLNTLLQRSREPLQADGPLRVWIPPSKAETYVIMGDPAEGLSTSHLSAAVVRRVSDWAHCATLRGQIAPGKFGDYLVDLARQYNEALLGWERNNHGWGVMERITTHHGYPNVYYYQGIGDMHGDGRYGFPTTGWNKPHLVGLAQAAMSTGSWHSWDSELIGQYMTLQDKGNGRYDTSVLDIAMSDMLCHAARPQARPPFRKRAESKPFAPRYLLKGRHATH
jgi:hypothetical protein